MQIASHAPPTSQQYGSTAQMLVTHGSQVDLSRSPLTQGVVGAGMDVRHLAAARIRGAHVADARVTAGGQTSTGRALAVLAGVAGDRVLAIVVELAIGRRGARLFEPLVGQTPGSP
jgi:hypothetical protein